MRISDARHCYLRWLQTVRDLSPHSLRAYGADIAALERFVGPPGVLPQLQPDRLLAFVEAQREAGLSASSVRRRMSGVRGFCRWLVRQQLLGSDPSHGASAPASRGRKLPRSLPRHELDTLLAFLRSAAAVSEEGAPRETLDRPHESTTLLAVALMVTTGVRVNEVVGIDCRDVDLPSRSIRLLGKGRRERHVFLTNDWIADLTAAYLTTRESLVPRHSKLLFNLRHEQLTTATVRARLAKRPKPAVCALTSRPTCCATPPPHS